MPVPDALELKLKALPEAPGVYLLKDAAGAVLYVGKAKRLRARVRSYFARAGGADRPLLPFLRRKVADLDVLLVANEKEALLLENSLIKQYKPRYNVRLVDDKTYLSLRLDRTHPFPRYTTVRRPREDGSRHFGPYASARSVRETLKLVYRNFGIRSCSDAVFANRSRPCLYYQIGQCLGPCVGLVGEPEYAERLAQSELFLAGREKELLGRLRDEMARHAAEERFEEAARVRDRIRSVERTLEKQDVASFQDRDFDVFGEARHGDEHVLVWLRVRDGRVIDSSQLRARNRASAPLAEILSQVLLGAYETRPIPATILCPEIPRDVTGLVEVLRERRGGPVALHRPERGAKRRLLEIACTNARQSLSVAASRGERNRHLLGALQELLGLGRLPRRIECFDISNLRGSLAVGSMAVAVDGELRPQEYRRYRIRSVEGIDDYAMMREVLVRRIGRGLEDSRLPDLLVVDGGQGQLQVAASVAEELGAEGMDLVGIAKGPERHAGRETLYRLRGDPLEPPRADPGLHLLQRVRDEAHRFAVTYHRKLRRDRDLVTRLQDAPGIGPARARALLRALGSLKAVSEASIDELAAVPGMNARSARALHGFLRGRTQPITGEG